MKISNLRLDVSKSQTLDNKNMNLSEITSYIHEHIPITASLGATVDFYDGETVVVSAPLEPNLNHRNTAFGGSISTLAILSGWVLLYLKLKAGNIDSRLVIQNSSTDFLEPISDSFTSTSSLPSDSDWKRFIQIFKRHGRARIKINSKIESSSGIGGNHVGTYVAIAINGSEY